MIIIYSFSTIVNNFQTFFHCFPPCSQYGDNLCDREVKALSNVEKSCSDFMEAVLGGYSLDRKASGLDDMKDTELQGKINQWMRDATGAPMCAFYK